MTQFALTKLAARPAAALFLTVALPASAQVSFTGFGTVGWAVSDQSFAFQRDLSRDGSFNRDSRFGLQMDARFSDQLSFVAQGKAAPSIQRDDSWDATLAWAFLAWRPNNDLLLRLGKVRVPYYLNSANIDVGVTYTAAQLPIELYSISPTNETTGISFSQSWTLGTADATLDGYWGISDSHFRFFMRDDLTAFGGPPRGAVYLPTRIDSRGLALTLQRQDTTLRLGIHQASASRRDGGVFQTEFPFVSVAPGMGFYVGDAASSPPGVTLPTEKHLHFQVFTAGFEVNLGADTSLAVEYARRRNTNATRGGLNSQGAYLALQRKIGPWTPYLSIARLLSQDSVLDLYQAVNGNRVSAPPLASATAARINASQRLIADRLAVYDQGTLALGTAYTLSPTQKLKAEWAVTRVGKVSNFVDGPAGGDVRNRNINVVSFSYNFTF